MRSRLAAGVATRPSVRMSAGRLEQTPTHRTSLFTSAPSASHAPGAVRPRPPPRPVPPDPPIFNLIRPGDGNREAVRGGLAPLRAAPSCCPSSTKTVLC